MCSLQLPTGKILLHSSFFLLPALSSLSVAPAALIFAVSKSSSSQKWQRAYPEGKMECSDLSNWVSSQMIGSASAEERIQSYSRKGHEEMGYRTMISTIRKTARFLTVAIPKVAYLLLGPGAHYNRILTPYQGKNQVLPLPVALMLVFPRNTCLNASARSLVWMLAQTGL